MKIYKPDNTLFAEILASDSSYRYRSIMGDNSITLYFSLFEHREMPIGAYCDFEGERYTLMRPQNVTMQHTRHFDYTVILDAEQAKLKFRKFRNNVDGRLKFSLTAKPSEHLAMLVASMNRSDSGWEVASNCLQSVEQCTNYDHASCYEALCQMAEAFKTEWEIKGKTIALRKVEYNKQNALPLSYGKGNGFKSCVSRTNYNEEPPIGTLFVQGGSDNIDYSQYGSQELHLPKDGIIGFDGSKFDNEQGYNASNAREYIADSGGFSIRRHRPANNTPMLAESSLDCSTIYPKRVGKVTEWECVNADKNFYDLYDTTIPLDLDYSKCLIKGEKMTVIFQSGMLAGKEFEVNYHHDNRRFEIVPQEIDGQIMPNETFKPKFGENGDTYAVFHCYLPKAYIREDSKKEGAEWDMMREAVRYMYDHESETYTFKGSLDGIWAKRDWENIGGRIGLGEFIEFTDANLTDKPILIRIVGIKDFLNNPHAPEIELSNEVISSSFATTMQNIASTEVAIEESKKEVVQYTKRRFRDTLETMEMLQNGLLNFSDSINPIAVQAMQLLVGDESLQFRFLDSNKAPIDDGITYNNTTKELICPERILEHLTLDIKDIAPSHDKHKSWTMTATKLKPEPTKRYYLYANCAKAESLGNKNTYVLSENAKAMTEAVGRYYFLIGILNSEYEGSRSFVRLYGFTEILPGRITTERIVSADGGSWFDLVNNAFKLGDLLKFNVNKDGKLRLKGTFVQSQSGDESAIGCYRGVYNNATTYYQGDEVTYTIGGVTSTYRYINANSSAGHAPNDTIYWQVIAKGSKGDKGENGTNGKDGKSPALVYRGVYESTKTYIGNDYRVDCVKYGNAYYATTPTTGEITAIPPTNDEAWRPFGGSFESIATGLLLAENANIANFIFANQRMESQTKTNGEPNIFLDGLNGLAKLGWLKVFGSDLIGIDDKGEERIRITPNALPTAGEASTTTDLKVVGRASNGVDGSASSTEVSFSFDAVFNDQEESNTLWGSVEYDIAESGTRLDLSDVLSSANLVDNRGEQIPHQFITEVLTADIYIQSETGWIRIADLKLTNGEYYAIIPQKGRIKVTITLSVYVGGSYNEWSGKIDFSAQAIRGRVKKEEIFLAKDGLMAIYNGNHLRFHSQNGFEMRVGNYGLKLTSTAIQKMTDGKTWNNL